MVANRHWCNKLWNAIRFALLNLGSGFQPSPEFPGQQVQQLPLACRWILSRLAATVKATVDGFASYEFGDAVQARIVLESSVGHFSGVGFRLRGLPDAAFLQTF